MNSVVVHPAWRTLGQVLGALLLIAVLIVAFYFLAGIVMGLMILGVLGWSLKWVLRW